MMCHWGLENFGLFCSWSFPACGGFLVCELFSARGIFPMSEPSCSWKFPAYGGFLVYELSLLTELFLFVSYPACGIHLLRFFA